MNPLDKYIRNKEHYSACSVNEYYYVYLRYLENKHLKPVVKQMNKRTYTQEQVYAFIESVIREKGEPLEPLHKEGMIHTYARNYKGNKHERRKYRNVVEQGHP